MGGMFISGTKFTVTEDKIDLLFYLVNISKCISVIGASPYTKNASFILENTHLEAVERNKDREQKAEVYGAIYGNQKLAVSEMVRLAKAFRVPVAESLTEDEVRDAVFNAVEARQQDKKLKDGYKTFLEFSDNSSRVEALGLIQKGKDMKRILYVQREAKWYTLDENGKKKEKICELVSGKTPDESLEFRVTTDEDILKILRQGIPELEEATTEA
jgi:hypothetical protein